MTNEQEIRLFKGLDFAKATIDDIEGMALIEEEYFGNYARHLDVEIITKWFNHNESMFYVVKNERDIVFGFMVLVPIIKDLYERVKVGEIASLVDFKESEVKKHSSSEYFLIENLLATKRHGTRLFLNTASMLLAGISIVLEKYKAKYALTLPITPEGKRITKNWGFTEVAKIVFSEESHKIYELVLTDELHRKMKRKYKKQDSL